jgi:hypothetical protein
MLLSKQYQCYEKLASTTCTLNDAKKIIQANPLILSFSVCQVLPIDRLCMSKTSNPDIIIYLAEQGVKQNIKGRGGLIRDKGICMNPLKMLIFNDRVDVLERLCTTNPPMLLPEDIFKYHFLHFAVGHCRVKWVRFFLTLNPKAACRRDNSGMLPIHLLANEWHKHPEAFWEVFSLLLVAGIKQRIEGDIGFGGLFDPIMQKKKTNFIDNVFKCPGVSWKKIANVVKDNSMQNVLICQLANGNISKEHIQDIIDSFDNCMFIKDDHGRLPIHIVSEHGLTWNDGMKYIVGANLAATRCVDEVTGLYPFALAAAGNGKDLGSIFELLRSFPDGCIL